MGTAGIVLASTAHMIARIVASFTFLRGYFSDVNVQFDLLSVSPTGNAIVEHPVASIYPSRPAVTPLPVCCATQIFPSAVSCSAFGVAYCVTLGSRLVLFPGVGFRTMALHVLVGACAFAAVVFCLYVAAAVVARPSTTPLTRPPYVSTAGATTGESSPWQGRCVRASFTTSSLALGRIKN